IQLCKNYFDAAEVIATCSSQSAPIVREMGADATIDYTKYRSLDGPVLEAANSGKFDLILDCCGNGDLFAHMSKILKPKLHYVTITGYKKFNYSNVSLVSSAMSSILAFFRVVLSFFGLNSHNYSYVLVPPDKKWAELSKQLIEEKKVKIYVDSV